MTLGTGTYQATLTDRSRRVVASVGGRELRSGSWSRALSDTSTASVVGRGLEQAEPWAHALTLWRSGRPVWSGPVVKGATTDDSTISARDLSGRWARRVARVPQTYTGDAARTAQLLLLAELAADDPDRAVLNLLAANAGVSPELVVDPSAPRYLSDAMKDLVGAGLTWTVVAGRLVLGRLVHEQRLQQLTDRDFVARLPVTTDGDATVTDATVIGKGCVGRWRTDAPATGAVERIEKRDNLTTIEECVRAARAMVDAGSTTPRVVTLPNSAQLDPGSAVDVDTLVPGVVVPIATLVGGAPVVADLQLHGVTVTFGPGAETVALSAGKPLAAPPATPSNADSAAATGARVGPGMAEPEPSDTPVQGFPPWWVEGPGIASQLPSWWQDGWATGLVTDAVGGR